MVRSLVFQVLYYLVSAIFVVLALPLLLLPGRKAISTWIHGYTHVMVFLMRTVGGVGVQVRGRAHLPQGPCIIAAKHQSWGDGFVMYSQIPDLAFVTGDHLMRFPLVGPILRKLDAIVVNNCGGTRARGRLVAEELGKARAEGRSILIYPEGHLSPVGTHHRYRKGVFHLYETYGVPVVPVATDLGLRWPEQQIRMRPGPCTVEFLEPIPAGLDKDTFMARLSDMIEDRSIALLHEQVANGAWPQELPAPPDAPRLTRQGEAKSRPQTA